MKTDAEKEKQINGSGLFFFKSKLTTNEKFEMLEWYNGLTNREQVYVDMFRKEATDESQFFNQES